MRLKEETYNLRLRVQIPAPGNTRWIFFQHLPTCQIVKYYFKNTDELFSQFGPKRCHVCFANDIYDNWADTVARLLCLSLPWPNEKEGTTFLLSSQDGRQQNGQKKWIELTKKYFLTLVSGSHFHPHSEKKFQTQFQTHDFVPELIIGMSWVWIPIDTRSTFFHIHLY